MSPLRKSGDIGMRSRKHRNGVLEEDSGKSSVETETGPEKVFGRTGIETGMTEKLNKAKLTQKIISETPEKKLDGTENGFNRTSCEE